MRNILLVVLCTILFIDAVGIELNGRVRDAISKIYFDPQDVQALIEPFVVAHTHLQSTTLPPDQLEKFCSMRISGALSLAGMLELDKDVEKNLLLLALHDCEFFPNMPYYGFLARQVSARLQILNKRAILDLPGNNKRIKSD